MRDSPTKPRTPAQRAPASRTRPRPARRQYGRQRSSSAGSQAASPSAQRGMMATPRLIRTSAWGSLRRAVLHLGECFPQVPAPHASAPEMVNRGGDPALGTSSELAPQSHHDGAAPTARRNLELPGTAGLEHIRVDHGLADRTRLPLIAAPFPDASKGRPEALGYRGEVRSLSMHLEVPWL